MSEVVGIRFKEVGKRKNYYEHPQEDARLMLWQS